MQRIGIVAGEPSGDFLGGDLIEALRRRQLPLDIAVEGVGGKRMASAGCVSVASMDRLAVMGLVEVLGRFAELYGLRRRLIARFLDWRPDVFIGVDAPDFNLDLELALRQRGIRTVHYVSPTVWAWRRNRLRKIAAAVDRVLLLFPFEQDIYRQWRIPAVWVGHPLADRIGMEPDRAAARRRLGLAERTVCVAVMPGSRRTELDRHLEPFLRAAARVRESRPDVEFLSSVLDTEAEQRCRDACRDHGLEDLPFTIFRDRAHDVLEAADLGLLASGTVTLEAMLFKLPMVVAYRMNVLTYRIIRSMVNVRFTALPNLLAGDALVPECLQDDCTPARLAAELLRWLDDARAVDALRLRFCELHDVLRRNAGERAAQAIVDLIAVR